MTISSLTLPKRIRLPVVSLRIGLGPFLTFFGWCGLLSAWVIGSGCLFAVLLRLTWRDSLPSLAPIFYGTPLALIWVGIASASALFFARGKGRLAMMAGVSAVICWGWWQHESVAAAATKDSPQAFRTLFWNTARFEAGWPGVAKEIQRMESPVMGFVEAGPDRAMDQSRWTEKFPNHEAVVFGKGLVLLVEGKVLQTTRGRLAKGCYYGRAEVELAGRRVIVLLVDLHSNPFYSREQAFQSLSGLIQDSAGKPLLLMGDFNTPSDSVHFHSLRQTLSNAFETAGRGPAETWPATLPVLTIDQIWVNRGLSAERARHVWSSESDHRAVLAELSFSKQFP